MKDKIQIRSTGSIESDDNRSISGYAIVFNSRSNKLFDIWKSQYFYETILPEAVTQEWLNTQDVRLLYNHNDTGRSLARFKQGEGTLHLTVDDKGVFFQFEAPNTAAGDEMLDSVRRGDVDRCSFAFYADPNDITESKNDDGTYERTIHKFLNIVEISLLDQLAAYEDTSVDNRQKNTDNMNDEQLKELQDKIAELEDKLNELQSTKMSDDEENTENVDSNEENPEENPAEDEQPEEEEQREDENPDESEDESEDESVENTNEENKENENRSMKKKNFSLIKAIREIVNNGQLSAENQAVSNLGAQEFRNAGISYSGQIQIPVETRDAVTVAIEGEDVVITDFTDILEPLRSNNVLADAGARIMTNLVGDLQVPSMNASQVGWKGEIAQADDADVSFDHILLQPKRLTAYVDISKQFLAQDSLGAENLIREDLVNAIQTKLESTILSADAGDTTKPAGIFYGVTPTTIADFDDLTALESDLEDANYNGEYTYIVSPKAKAALRSMIKGTNGTGMVFENGEVDGTPALTTTHMATKTLAVGDWSNLVIGQWSAIDITVDPFSQAVNGVVRIVINAFFDAKMAREGGIVYGTVE